MGTEVEPVVGIKVPYSADTPSVSLKGAMKSTAPILAQTAVSETVVPPSVKPPLVLVIHLVSVLLSRMTPLSGTEDIGCTNPPGEGVWVTYIIPAVPLELPEEKFRKLQTNFREIDKFNNEIVISISDIDFTFVLKK